MAELEDSYRLIAVDVRGHGDSDTPSAPFTIEDLADDVIELTKAIGGGKVIVGGCSFGGQISQGVGVKAPELLNGIFISNTGHRRNDRSREALEARAVAAEKGMEEFAPTMLDRWFNDEYKIAHPDRVALIRDWLTNANPIVHAWCWRAIKSLNFSESLRELKIPALAIAGGQDLSTSAAVIQAMAADIPDCAYRCCQVAGHLAPFEQPKEYACYVRQFAERIVTNR